MPDIASITRHKGSVACEGSKALARRALITARAALSPRPRPQRSRHIHSDSTAAEPPCLQPEIMRCLTLESRRAAGADHARALPAPLPPTREPLHTNFTSTSTESIVIHSWKAVERGERSEAVIIKRRSGMVAVAGKTRLLHPFSKVFGDHA
ncbi:unnamed protein product, partial [Iphiclides podalirius]